MIYRPKIPYISKNGYFKGKCLDLMMFYNYREIRCYLEKEKYFLDDLDDLTKIHVEWLVEKGENRLPQLICPICKKRRVVFFGVDYSFNSCYGSDFEINSKKTCCDNLACKNKILDSLLSREKELKRPLFSEVLNLAILPEDQKKIGDLYKEVYMLPNELSSEEAFNFFNS